MAFIIAYGLLMSGVDGIEAGLYAIINAPDVLVTDYIYIGGPWAALVNAALVGLSGVVLLIACKHKPRGLSLAALWLLFGFALFGKNILNIWPIILGGFLYSRFVGKPFNDNILVTLFATALAPAVSTAFGIGMVQPMAALAYSVGVGVVIGFVIFPIGQATVKAHDGFNLYNVGFAAGILGIVLNSAHQSFGINLELSAYWGSGYDTEMFVFVHVVSFALILAGVLLRPLGSIFGELRQLFESPKDKLDYFSNIGGVAYINMGLMGIISVWVAQISGVGLSGPVLGAIFSVIGFGAAGKTCTNAPPIMLGATLAAVTSPLGITSAVVVNILFGTCLSPITTGFGKWWGLVAGFVHMHLVTSLAITHGGMNLYNNGASAGFVAIIIVAVARTAQERKVRLRG